MNVHPVAIVCRQCRSTGSPKPCDIDCNIRAHSTCTYALQLTARHGVYSCHRSTLMSVRARRVFISVAKAQSRRRATLARVSKTTTCIRTHDNFDVPCVPSIVLLHWPCFFAWYSLFSHAGQTAFDVVEWQEPRSNRMQALNTRSRNKHEPRSSTYNTQHADGVLVVS